MSTFTIEGGLRLKGSIEPQGAKNEALQILCATLLTNEKVTINNIPDIRDVNKLIDLIGDIGVEVERENRNKVSFTAKNINSDFLSSREYLELSSALRGSVMLLGPLLARTGSASMPKPGGDKIGRRRVDTHFTGFDRFQFRQR